MAAVALASGCPITAPVGAVSRVSNPSWVSAFLVQKNTFIDVLPQLVDEEETPTTRRLRRQNSDPSPLKAPAGGFFPDDEPHSPSFADDKDRAAQLRDDESTGSTCSDVKSTGEPESFRGASKETVDTITSVVTCSSVGSSPFDSKELTWRCSLAAAKRVDEEEAAELMSSMPLDEDGEPTSLGSSGHAAGNCRPCAFVTSKTGCDAGVLCRFCHFRHTSNYKFRARPCKGKRDRYRKLLDKLAAELDENPDTFNLDAERLPPSIKYDPRFKRNLAAKMQQYASGVAAQQKVVSGAAKAAGGAGVA